MRNQTSVLLLFPSLLIAQGPPTAAELSPPAAMSTIGKEELLRHATYLASDELGGRLTGSPGQRMAADYVAKHFQDLGLEPWGEEQEGGNRSYFQHYGIHRTFVKDGSQLQVGGTSLTEGYALLGARPITLKVDVDVVFCGFGRTRGLNADVPNDCDLTGKLAVAAIRPPRGRLSGDLTTEQKFGMSFMTLGTLHRTAKGLADRGAAAVLFVLHDDPTGFSDVLNYLALAPGKDSVEANFPGADPGMGGLGRGGREGAPSLVLSVPASRRVLDELGIDAAAFAAFVEGKGDAPEARGEVRAHLDLAVERDEQAKASNVVALLRGSDPELAEEAVIYSAHMDHVGRRIDGDVFNGADDNASGSAGLLTIASAYARAEERPRRSVLFLSVSGEELGLWGSQFFADNPTWPLDKIVADVNTDMIGRSGPESAPLETTVTPSFRHSKYSTLVRDSARFAQHLGMTFTDGDKYYQRSDHYNFAKKGIPVVFFCDGEHEDYHQVTDSADKLDGDKMERIARLAFWTGWATANSDGHPRRLGRQEDW